MDGARRWVALPENQSAWQAMTRFATATLHGDAQPLLFLHGPPGSGKSHLVGDLLRRILHEHDGATAQVVAAADVGRELQMPTIERRDVVRSLLASDVLVLEDVQHLPATISDDIATVIDKRLNRRKNCIVTANVGPGQLSTPARLASRFVGGLVVALAPWSVSSRQTFAAAMSQDYNLHLAPDVIAWLARHPGGARPMLGELQQLQALATLHAPPLTLAIIQAELPELADTQHPLERIIACVAEHYRLSPKLLCGASRLKNVVWPRQVAMYLARQQGMSLTAIGQRFAKRDHTTVLHSCTKVEEAVQGDVTLAQVLQDLQAKLV